MKNNQITSVEVVEVEAVASAKKVSYRQDFIKVCSNLIDNKEVLMNSFGIEEEEYNKFKEYFETQINKSKSVEKGEYKPTEKAETILNILIAFEGEYITGKAIAENSNGELKSNGVSGSIRALITNGMVESTETTPKQYKITQKGIDYLG